ncbi:hypothetical protein FIM05_01520 [SAR202 cluster bacterium AD-802-K11_MRT_200m]|nr:hypothetical protein [SAR202 cluster bacterium AD-802-K11_MRT_200m]
MKHWFKKHNTEEKRSNIGYVLAIVLVIELAVNIAPNMYMTPRGFWLLAVVILSAVFMFPGVLPIVRGRTRQTKAGADYGRGDREWFIRERERHECLICREEVFVYVYCFNCYPETGFPEDVETRYGREVGLRGGTVKEQWEHVQTRKRKFGDID